MLFYFVIDFDFHLITRRAHYSNETYKNYAKFDGLSTSVGYNFTVYSANTEGLSTEYSTVYVPSESDSKSTTGWWFNVNRVRIV